MRARFGPFTIDSETRQLLRAGTEVHLSPKAFDLFCTLIESRPKVFYFTDHYRDYPIVLIRLSKASRSIVEPLLRRHWCTLASKAAMKASDAG